MKVQTQEQVSYWQQTRTQAKLFMDDCLQSLIPQGASSEFRRRLECRAFELADLLHDKFHHDMFQGAETDLIRIAQAHIVAALVALVKLTIEDFKLEGRKPIGIKRR